ncbi:ATP-binding protein [Mucilaginibacter sp. AW1-7]|uniref:sensor histidine kinase n=1 Tax=unclassified Mucilaginibacter TaxID=2617802 RepID=UPI0023655C94|nr:HAMP domain-containing sensor histidine kinase [Mucilaginibacter sp. KACC 22773]WDF80797.1 HAMP domain-containing sensor histidine kinase [Mucilaginibacter sp. KACC 22773]
MKIKNRLALNFTLLSSAMLLIIMASMYLAFANFFRTDFYGHLKDRAKVAAQLYLEADEISSDSLNHVRERMLEQLPNEVIRVYNANNIASFIKDKEQYWSFNTIEEVRAKKYISFREGERQTIGIYYHDNQGNFVILASAYDQQAKVRLSGIIRIMIIILIVVNSVLFFIGRWFAKRSLMPIDGLIKQMKQINASSLHVRVDEGKGKDEISALALNFNRLLSHLQNSFELQQTFVANASHELRTPVTSIIGEVEVALNKQRSIVDYERLLNSVLNDAGRLSDTISSLMELAQTDMEYTRAKLEPIQIDEQIWELQHHWAMSAGHPQLQVQIDHLPDDQQALFINANPTLLKIAFNNIIGNAFKFSHNQPVTCRLNADDQSIVITIIDKGVGIPAEDQEKIFTPFYRSANGRVFDGNGVGLYVAFKIIQLFNGTINIQSVVGQGTTFTISFVPIF